MPRGSVVQKSLLPDRSTAPGRTPNARSPTTCRPLDLSRPTCHQLSRGTTGLDGADAKYILLYLFDAITMSSSHASTASGSSPAQTTSSPSMDNSSNAVAAVKSVGKPADAVMEAVSFPAAGTSSSIVTADNRTRSISNIK
ncbi:hypothetical protein CSPX01_10247 [Colletotrichum filicis]|nr:hypothetical protein CSPX01_10247 [Colletotrichum filicis]